MKIAILMSTYNGEKFLNEQLESLYNQHFNGEMVVYIRDDGSTDKTIQIIDNWKLKMNIVLFEESNVGPAESFWWLFTNRNIKADYYAFCDQDDVWDCLKIHEGTKMLSTEEDEALWCSNCSVINSDGEVIIDKMNNVTPNFSIESQFVCGTTQGCSMIFNNKLRDYILDKKINDMPMHDFVVLTYAIAKGKVIYDNRNFFKYRVHDKNVIANKGKNRFTKIKSSLNRWFSKEHKNEISRYAQKFHMDNISNLNNSTLEYIKCISECQSNIHSRIKLIVDKRSKSNNIKAERSFKIRALLGIL